LKYNPPALFFSNMVSIMSHITLIKRLKGVRNLNR
jgi:hypothetical protein